MTTGHHRASSAGAVADAIATWIDDRFRLNGDAVQMNRRLAASLCAVAVPLVDGAGRRVTRLAGSAGHVLSRGAWRAELAGSAVADEVADAGRDGARALRDAASSTRNAAAGSAGGAADAGRSTDLDGSDAGFLPDEALVEVEVVEVVELSDLGVGAADDDGFLGEGLDQDLAADLGPELDEDLGPELDDPMDDDPMDDDLDDGMLDEVPPPFLAAAAPAGPEPLRVEDLDPVAGLDDLDGETDGPEDAVTAEAVERTTGATGETAAERRAGRRTAGTRSRTEGRPPRRAATPRSGRRESTPTGGRTTRG